jgi:hypothetical protein
MFGFDHVITLLKQGKRLSRVHWGNMCFIFLVQGSQFNVNRAPLTEFYPMGTPVNYKPHIDIQLSPGTIMVWTPTQEDMMADDWLELL